ncbi:MAG: glycogen/starch synthase [Thermoprotei archaeon]
MRVTPAYLGYPFYPYVTQSKDQQMRFTRVPGCLVPESVDKVWLMTFEFAGVASLGGLGNAVRRFAEGLRDQGVKVTVIMPAHGRHYDPEFSARAKLRDFGLTAEGDRVGLDGNRYHYRIGFEFGELDGVELILVKGRDHATSSMLDDPYVYAHVEEKASLFARAMEALVPHAVSTSAVPSVIHANDWHTAVAGVRARQLFEDRKYNVPLVYTVHLLNEVSFPWHYASLDWSGLRDCPVYVWKVHRHEVSSHRELWEQARGNVERFAVLESDAFSSVSRAYLRNVVLPRVGEWLEGKSCVVYNSTDWRVDEVKAFAERRFGTSDRLELRKRLLNELPNVRAVPEDFNTGNTLWNARRSLGIRDDWTYEPLGDGPLFVFSGRLVFQKGPDLLVRAFLEAIQEVRDARLLILGIPSGDYGLLRDLVDHLSRVRDNARIVASKGIDPNLFKAFIYSATALVMPSRWEPFGLSAVEAMAVGTPVIAYGVDGLSETVIDLRFSSESGTGFLAHPESVWELKEAIVTASALSKAYEQGDGSLMGRAMVDVDWRRVRESAMRRVDSEFRPSSTARRLMDCYRKALQMATYRANSYG